MPGLTVKVNMPWQTSWCRWFTSTYYKDVPSGYACLFCNPGLQCLVNMPAILDSQAHLCYRLMSTNNPPPWFRRKRWPCCESRGARSFEKSSLDLRIGGKKGWHCHICIGGLCQLHSFLFMPRSRNFRLSRLFKPEGTYSITYNYSLKLGVAFMSHQWCKQMWWYFPKFGISKW